MAVLRRYLLVVLNSINVISQCTLLQQQNELRVRNLNMKEISNKKRYRRTSIFWSILREYLSRSQVQGYKFIIQDNRPLYERVFWFIVTICGILSTFWLVLNSYLDFLVSPTVTSEDPIHVSVLELPFPGVAICSANRISKRALINYSKFILNATKHHIDHIGRSVDEVFENLLRMGQMYTMELVGNDLSTLEKVHNVLRNIHGGPYPIYEILTNLTPKCDDMLKACKWQGHSVLCSQIFMRRRSFMGPCCSFNYQRPLVSLMTTQQNFNQTIPPLNKSLTVQSHGSEFGLTVLIDHNLDDYAFTMNSYIGVNVLIFDSYNFPDQTSGAVNEKIISPEEEVFLTLHPVPVEGSRSMKHFAIDSRNCVFDEEISLVFANLSECLLTCRVSNIIDFCGCSPSYITNLYTAPPCLFSDLPCLNRWRLNWFNFEPMASNADRNMDINDVHCPECVPKCSRISNITDVSNHSILYINFGTNKVATFHQTTMYVWYELLANLGGIGCLCLGATMVSIIEMFYFFSGKFGALWTKETNRNSNGLQFDYLN